MRITNNEHNPAFFAESDGHLCRCDKCNCKVCTSKDVCTWCVNGRHGGKRMMNPDTGEAIK